jgi:succinyl-CoA synthetase alpha subunit
MSILIDKNTRVICQGFTGKNGTFHSEQAIAYGTKMVGGTSPGKGGSTHLNLPVFDTVREAREKTGANASVVYVPPPGAADAICEAIDAEIPLIVCITEGIPVLDMVRVKRSLAGSKSRLIGPNCPGIVTAASRRSASCRRTSSSRLGRNRVALRHADLRGGFPDDERGAWPDDRRRDRRRPRQGHRVHRHPRAVPRRREDNVHRDDRRDRRLGRGGAAQFIADEAKRGRKKPMVGFIAGRTAPPGRRMGHAGAIISGGKGGAEDKIAAMEAAGIKVSPSPARLGKTLVEVLRG